MCVVAARTSRAVTLCWEAADLYGWEAAGSCFEMETRRGESGVDKDSRPVDHGDGRAEQRGWAARRADAAARRVLPLGGARLGAVRLRRAAAALAVGAGGGPAPALVWRSAAAFHSLAPARPWCWLAPQPTVAI